MKVITLTFLLLLIGFINLSLAETTAVQEDLQGQVEETGKKPGYYVGGIRYMPKIDISGTYNDNIYATDKNRVSDFITVVRGNLAARSDWERHQLSFNIGGKIGSYWDTPDEDYTDYWADLKGRYDISSQSNVFGGLGYSFLHESRDSPDANLSGIFPTTYSSKNAHLGLSHSLGSYTFRLGGTYENLEFNNVPTLFGGTLDNEYRDRTLTGLGMRATRKISESSDLFAQLLFDKRKYDETTDQYGYQKDSDGYRAAVGIKQKLEGLGRFEAYFGLLAQNYDDPRFKDIRKPDFAGSLTILPSARSKLVANLDRELYETTQAGSAGYLYTSLGARFDYRFLPKLTGQLNASYATADYLDVEREDDYIRAGLGLKYQLTPNFFLAADYLRVERDSNERTSDFKQDLFFLSLGMSPYPKFEPGISSADVDGEIELGAIYVDEGSLWFGNYTGLSDHGFYGLANVDATAKIDNTSRSRLLVDDLGLDSRSILFTWEDRDKFRAYVSWDELPSYQYTAQVIFGGVKTPNLTVPDNWFDNPPIDTTRDMDQLAASLFPVDIGAKRKQLDFGGRFRLKESWVLDASYKSVNKQGLRSLGGAIGTSPGQTRAALLPEPVDWTDHQIDLALATGGRLGQFDLKYHGSFFQNAYDRLAWESPFSPSPGSSGNRYTDGQVGLSPDNHFHQISVSGNYLLSQSTRTRLSGVYSYGLMLQDDDYLPYTINPGGAANTLPTNSLDGRVAMQNAIITLTSRPAKKLRLNASYRLNDRDNKTGRETYNYVTADSKPGNTTAVTNNPYGYRQDRFKIDAKYRLHRKADLVLGYDKEKMKRRGAERKRTDEDTYRAELKLRPTNKIQASLNIERSKRDGSDYETLPGENPLLRKYNMADRDRDMGGIRVTYLPRDDLSISASANRTKDDYDETEIGLTGAKRTDFTIDSSLQISRDMNVFAYYSWESIKADQAGSESGGAADWTLDFDDRIQSVGLGLKKENLVPNLDLTLDYVYSDAKGERDLNAPPAPLAPSEPYPDLSTKVHTFKLTADYQFKKSTTFRVRYWYEKYSSDDWAVDGVLPDSLRNVLTIGAEAPNYSEHVVSASVVYRF